MRKKNRSFLLMSLISASLLVSVFTIVQAQSPAAPADPLTLASVVVLLGLIALLASYIPARRASRLDPVVASRHVSWSPDSEA